MFVSNFQIRKDADVPYLEVQITKDGSVPLRFVDMGQTCPSATTERLDNIVDLTGATVTFQMKKCGRTPTDASINGTCEILEPKTSGRVRYKWAKTDTAVVGLFYGTFVITFTGGKVYKWPRNLESLSIQIVD